MLLPDDGGGRIILVDHEGVTVISVEAGLGAQPHESPLILGHRPDSALKQPLLLGNVVKCQSSRGGPLSRQAHPCQEQEHAQSRPKPYTASANRTPPSVIRGAAGTKGRRIFALIFSNVLYFFF